MNRSKGFYFEGSSFIFRLLFQSSAMNINDLGVNKMQASSREARSNQRRLLTAFGLENDSDLLKFNQLKVIFLILYEKKIITIP